MADRRPKRPRDPAQLAKLMVDIATGEVAEQTTGSDQVRSRASSMGAKGGKKRAEVTSPSRRQEIAKNAASARWKANADGER